MKTLTILLALALPGAALAQGDPRAGSSNEPGYTIPGGVRDSGSRPKLNEAGRSFRGEVRAVDKVMGTVRLKHDTMTTLGVPAGTTEYSVKDSSMLEHVKVGDEVRFNAVLQGRSLLITHIGPAN